MKDGVAYEKELPDVEVDNRGNDKHDGAGLTLKDMAAENLTLKGTMGVVHVSREKQCRIGQPLYLWTYLPSQV